MVEKEEQIIRELSTKIEQEPNAENYINSYCWAGMPNLPAVKSELSMLILREKYVLKYLTTFG